MIVQGVIDRAISPQDQPPDMTDMFPWDGSHKNPAECEEKTIFSWKPKTCDIQITANNTVGSQKCDRVKLNSSVL